MHYAQLLWLLILPVLFVSAQSSNGGSRSTTVVTTILSTSIGTVGRQQTTAVVSQVITTVIPVQTGNSNSSSTNSGNSTSKTTTPANLPTAPSDVDGGGSGGAPSPGQSSPNGIYGPDDNYIAAASRIARSAFAVSLACSVIAGVLIIL